MGISLFLTACGATSNNPATSPNTNTSANTNATANKANATAAAPASPAKAAAPKPAGGAKRIEFKKGEFSGGEDLTLAPGASASFVIGAGNDQKVYIESSDTSGSIKTKSGKVAELSNEKGYFDGITQSKGDITFTVTNPGKTEMKTKLSITLVPNGD